MKLNRKQFQEMLDIMQSKDTDIEKVIVNIDVTIKEEKTK